MPATFRGPRENYERPGPCWGDFLVGAICFSMIGLALGVIVLRLLSMISTPLMFVGLVLPAATAIFFVCYAARALWRALFEIAGDETGEGE